MDDYVSEYVQYLRYLFAVCSRDAREENHVTNSNKRDVRNTDKGTDEQNAQSIMHVIFSMKILFTLISGLWIGKRFRRSSMFSLDAKGVHFDSMSERASPTIT